MPNGWMDRLLGLLRIKFGIVRVCVLPLNIALSQAFAYQGKIRLERNNDAKIARIRALIPAPQGKQFLNKVIG